MSIFETFALSQPDNNTLIPGFAFFSSTIFFNFLSKQIPVNKPAAPPQIITTSCIIFFS
jgi:hypothetical protein